MTETHAAIELWERHLEEESYAAEPRLSESSFRPANLEVRIFAA